MKKQRGSKKAPTHPVHSGKAWKLIEALGSLKLAMLLLLTIAVACAVATVTESRLSAAAAYQLIYNSPWFNAWLALLCINLLCSALTRWPWEKRHIGFVVTHMGIILLLIGAMIGRIWGLEANVTLEVGQPPKTRLVAIRKSILLVQSARTGELYSMPFQAELLNKRTSLPLPDSSFRLQIEKQSRNLNLRSRLVSSSDPSSGPCIHLRMQSGMVPKPIDVFLSAESPDFDFFGRGQIQWRPTAAPAEPIHPSIHASSSTGLLLELWPAAQGVIGYRSSRHGKIIAEGRLALGSSLDTGWADWNLQLVAALPKGRVEAQIEDADSEKNATSGRLGRGNAVEGFLARLVDPGSHKQGEAQWVVSGASQKLALGDYETTIGYGLETYPLSFGIELESFEVPRDSHSNEPADFISSVHFTDAQTGEEMRACIQMNVPATYPASFWRKVTGLTYKFSQAGWNPENPRETTLQVLYDPGWFFKWTGSLMISLGIFTMFYLKPKDAQLEA